MKIGKIVLQNGTEAEFGLDGWTSTDAAVAEYLNFMFGKETYRPQDGRWGVKIIHDAAEKMQAKPVEYPREIKPPQTTTAVKQDAAVELEDDDEDDDPWVEKTNDFLESLEE